jgi:hypothetical protein
MPWINNDIPEQPVLHKKSATEIEATYEGNLQLKGFGLFILPHDKELKFINTQLVQLILSKKSAVIDLSRVRDGAGKKIYIATVDINNNVSELKELK